jgi:hypothetical protein
MLPTASGDGLLSSLTLNGSPVSYSTQTIKGLEYAFFPAAAGTYAARYGAASAPAISAVTAATTEAGTPTISWSTSVPATTEVIWRDATASADQQTIVAESTREHTVELSQVDPGETYAYRVRSRDEFGHTTMFPAADKPPATYAVPARSTVPPGMSGVRAMGLPDGSASVQWDTNRRAVGQIQYGTAAGSLGDDALDADTGTTHELGLSDMTPGQRYYFRVTSRTPWGTAETSATLAFDMPDYGVADSRLAQWRMGQVSGLALGRRGDGELRLAASSSSGSYVSRVLDPGQMVGWKRALWDADVPADTSLTVQVRTGSMSTPDSTWTPWIDVTSNGAQLPAGVKPSRYLQYRLRLTGSGGASPVVRAIGFTSTGVAPDYPTEGGG